MDPSVAQPLGLSSDPERASERRWAFQEPFPPPRQPGRDATARTSARPEPRAAELCPHVLRGWILGPPPWASKGRVQWGATLAATGEARGSRARGLSACSIPAGRGGWRGAGGAGQGTGSIRLHRPARGRQPRTAEHSNPLIRCRARLSELQCPRGGISNKMQERETRVENVWLFVSLLARNTTALVPLVGAFLRGAARCPRCWGLQQTPLCGGGSPWDPAQRR